MMSREETRRWMMTPSDSVRTEEEMVGKVALMWLKCSREWWWQREGRLGE